MKTKTEAEKLSKNLTHFVEHPEEYPACNARIDAMDRMVLRAAAHIMRKAVKR